MKRSIPRVLGCLILLTVAAASTNAVRAAAQCHWRCLCVSYSCACDKEGKGSECSTDGDTCVVVGCEVDVTPRAGLTFAPDGSVLRAPEPSDSSTDVDVASSRATLSAIGWEFVTVGRSVARHCSGIVVDRWYDPTVAEKLRREAGLIMI